MNNTIKSTLLAVRGLQQCASSQRHWRRSCGFLDTECFDLDDSDFDEHTQEYIRVINECYKCSEQTEEMRKLTFLDPLRSPDYPDDIQVLLYQKGMQIERVWVKCFAYTEDELFGKLLNESNQDFGVYNGSTIGFAPVETENGLLCVYTGRWLEEQSEYFMHLFFEKGENRLRNGADYAMIN